MRQQKGVSKPHFLASKLGLRLACLPHRAQQHCRGKPRMEIRAICLVRPVFLEQANDGWMQLPESLNLRRSSRQSDRHVIKIQKCQSYHVSGKSCRQFAAVLHVQRESMLKQLGLNTSSRTAIFRVHWCFHDDPASCLVRGLGNFKNHIAVFTVGLNSLQVSRCDMPHLQFHPGSRRIDRAWVRLWPAIHSIDRKFHGSHRRDGHMFLCVTVFQSQFERRALAEIFRLHFAGDGVERAARLNQPGYRK